MRYKQAAQRARERMNEGKKTAKHKVNIYSSAMKIISFRFFILMLVERRGKAKKNRVGNNALKFHRQAI